MEAAVPTSTELSDLPLRHGWAKKRNNAIVAVLSGALPGVILTFYLPVSWERWLLGLIIGLIWWGKRRAVAGAARDADNKPLD